MVTEPTQHPARHDTRDHAIARRLKRWSLLLAAPLLALSLAACDGSDAPAATGTTVTTTTTATISGIGPAGGSVESPQGVKIVVPAGALSSTVSIAISSDTTGAPSIAAGVTSTGAVFALLPHGTSFATAVTITVPFDPALVPPGQTPKLYKAEVGGSYTEIPSTVVGTTLVALVTNFSWVQPGVTGAPSAPQVLAEPDDKAVRVSWTGKPGESYQVCMDLTPSAVAPGSTFYPSQCTSATAPYTYTGLTNDSAYTFTVIASNAAGTAGSAFNTVTPKALARTWTSYATGYYDPYSSDPTTYGSGGYNDVAYMHTGGQDVYVGVKSTRQTVRIADDGDPVHQPNTGALLYTLRAVAAGNGYFIAVGDNGTIGYSQDGTRWTYAQMGQFQFEFAYTAIAYVPAPGNAPGRFIAVGNWYDSYGLAHDLITTIDPTVGACANCTSSFLPGIYHQKFDQGSNPIAVHSSGLVVGNTQGYYYTYPSPGDIATANGAIIYRVTGNLDAGTAAGATIQQTLTSTQGFNSSSYGASTRVIKFRNQYWALTGGTGGLLSDDGVTWPAGNNYSFQIHNPDPGRYTTGFVAGPGQMVGVSTDGEFFYNSTGGNNINSWTDVDTYLQLGNAPRLVYGGGRYIAIGTSILRSH